jgi:Phage integrase family
VTYHGPSKKWHKNGTEMTNQDPKTLPRNIALYWERRVYLPKHKEAESTHLRRGYYHVKIQAHGERRGVSLQETEKREAGKKAKQLDTLVRANGWTEGLQMFRGEAPTKKNNLTLSEYFAEVAATGFLKAHTLSTYITKVRTIAADITKPKLPVKKHKNGEVKPLSRYDHVNGGSAVWQELVGATPLARLNDAALLKWRSERIKAVAANPKQRESSIKTVNSAIRAGFAMFGPKITQLIPHVQLPDPIPFRLIQLLPESIQRYRSEIPDPDQLLAMGVDELALATPEIEFQNTWTENGGSGKAPKPSPAERIQSELSATRKNEAFKILILGLCAGLRRGEIDSLQWSQVDFTKNCIWAETTEAHEIKANSSGEIPLDPHIMGLLEEWHKDSGSSFVLSGGEAKPEAEKTVYRANRFHKELIAWLKSKGITGNRPIHSLRKEYGSVINAQAGIHAASRLLRHKNISLTSAIYTDSRNKVTAGLGLSLVGKKK